jgi:hypothetical protein
LPGIDAINDEDGKPFGIELHIGRWPVFEGVNVISGGGIAMMQYSKESSGRVATS